MSVVIPTHNRAELLPRAIESVLRQHSAALDAFGGLEVIVVDDASTDQTPAVAKRYSGALTFLRNDCNRERGASRNQGATAARGDWLAFLDSDDEWEDGKLGAQLDVIGDRHVCVTRSWLIDERGSLLGMGSYDWSVRASEIEVMNPYRAGPSSLLVNRELFQRLGGFPEERSIQGSEDWLFMAKLWHAGVSPVIVNRPLVRYRVHTGNWTAAPDTYLPTTLAAVDWLERHELTTPARARIARSHQYEVAARAYALGGQLSRAVWCMHRAVALHPHHGRLAIFGRTACASIRAGTRRHSLPWLDPRAA